MNVRKLTSKFVSILAVVSLIIINLSCTNTETTDSTTFMIYYSGVTDIGPSMNFNLNAPSYKGSAPSNFAITKVTYNNEAFTGDSFIVDAATGVVTISNTAQLKVGKYRISISCMSNGDIYQFDDAIEVNMMAPVPDGVTVEPNVVEIDFADIKTDNKTAQVKTNGDHVSIIGYEVIQEESKAYFAISKTGEISVNPKYKGEIPPGIHKVSLKLTTGAGECIFEEAVTFNITSSPLELTYTPNKGNVEINAIYASAVPIVKGSLEEMNFAIKKISPATDKIKIDAATGVLSIDANNNLAIGSSYSIDIAVSNKYGVKDFVGVYTIDVVAYIAPIENFTYNNQEVVQSTPFEVAYNAGFVGDMVNFELIDLPAALNGQLTIDSQTGIVSASKGNTIAKGTYTVKVKASNTKSEKVATFTLTITENPNLFTYIRYGNNLGLSPIQDYANQYRLRSEGDLKSLKITPQTDINRNAEVEWSVSSKYKMKDVSIDPSTGELSFTNVAWREDDGKGNMVLVPGGMVLVKAVTGKGTASEFALTIPVFFHFAAPVEDGKLVSSGVVVNYTPFVLQVNPRVGGKSVAPTIEGVSDQSKFIMDYRRTFNYYNIGANHKDGQPAAKGFMYEIWDRYYKGLTNPESTNTGSKDPMSYYSNVNGKNGRNLGLTAGYVDGSDGLKVVIQPNKWRGDDNVYANGVLIGQMTFVTDGNVNGVNNGLGTFPLYIWFDEKFN